MIGVICIVTVATAGLASWGFITWGKFLKIFDYFYNFKTFLWILKSILVNY
jgi:hypothetical protein